MHSPGDAFIQTSVTKQCRKGAITWEDGRDENTLILNLISKNANM